MICWGIEASRHFVSASVVKRAYSKALHAPTPIAYPVRLGLVDQFKVVDKVCKVAFDTDPLFPKMALHCETYVDMPLVPKRVVQQINFEEILKEEIHQSLGLYLVTNKKDDPADFMKFLKGSLLPILAQTKGIYLRNLRLHYVRV